MWSAISAQCQYVPAELGQRQKTDRERGRGYNERILNSGHRKWFCIQDVKGERPFNAFYYSISPFFYSVLRQKPQQKHSRGILNTLYFKITLTDVHKRRKSRCCTQALSTRALRANSILVTFQRYAETGVSPPSASPRATQEPRRWRDRPCWLWWDQRNCNEDWKRAQSRPNRCLSEGDGWLRSLQGCLKWRSLQLGKETGKKYYTKCPEQSFLISTACCCHSCLLMVHTHTY